MSGLFDVWVAAQRAMPDERLMVKTADGELPITKRQLMNLVANLEPGESFEVGGLRFVLGPDGESLQMISTSNPDPRSMPDNSPLGKSASYRRGSQESQFGNFLLNEFNRNQQRRSL
jgi:hypothetical protein